MDFNKIADVRYVILNKAERSEESLNRCYYLQGGWI